MDLRTVSGDHGKFMVRLRQMFLETDDAPVGIGEIYGKAAALLGIGVEELREAIFGNYEKVFGKR